MPARHRIPALISAAAAATILLGGCASTGTLSSAGASGGSDTGAAPNSSATTDATPASATTTDDSAATTTDAPTTTEAPSKTTTSMSADDPLAGVLPLVSDAGCKESLTALDDMLKLQSDPAKLVTQFPGILANMRDGAKKTKKPGAAAAINKMADDLQGISKGQAVDQTKMQSDGSAVGAACIA